MRWRTYLPSISSPATIAGQDSAPNATEMALASLITRHPEQGRATMHQHPLLMQVARAKALDMATRGYDGHTDPDGHGPNWLLRQAGYRLPDWYGQDADANNVESLGRGYATAANAFSGWLKSAGHRAHVLAENLFYSQQTNYGVGYVFVAGSKMQHYYVFLSAPVEEHG